MTDQILYREHVRRTYRAGFWLGFLLGNFNSAVLAAILTGVIYIW